MRFFSPAKINLFLKVLGKRPDGFHQLLTRYQVISFGDELTIARSNQDSFFCSIPELCSEDNLIWKSTRVFRSYTKITEPVSWNLTKCIPLGAGLGGGSSNAATALYALNVFFRTRIPQSILRELGKQIGMDVPLFFSSGSVLGKGRGEQIESCPPIHGERYVLYPSHQGILTREVFDQLIPSDYSTSQPIIGENDLESPVFRLRPDLKQKKTTLERMWSPFQGKVCMSGSGATLYVRYPQAIENQTQTRKRLQQVIQESQGIECLPLFRCRKWYSLNS